MGKSVEEFKREREQLNEIVRGREDLNIKRFFGLDSAVYRQGALSAKAKELLGLIGSLVLRCDDCISYHTIRAKEAGVNEKEFDEVMSIGLVIGGSITIPHVRRAFRTWNELHE